MAGTTILVVEDDKDILHLVTYNLETSGFTTLTAEDGYEALSLAKRYVPDLVILDLMLPDVDGFEVCKELKRATATKDIPVLMLTARGEEVDRIVGLELGADDYVVKPFSPRELILRVRAILRRWAPKETTCSVWQYDGLLVDLEAHRVTVDDEEVYLTATELRLLVELIRNQGKVQSRDSLLDKVWGYQFEGYGRTVDTHVRRLRRKLGPYADLVETVRGVGYRFRG
jgi:two-component system phosphate regulon response regulator PhoB